MATSRVYISGPMTGLPDLNRPAFDQAAEALAAAGFDPVNPADVYVYPEDIGGRIPEWSDYMRRHVVTIARGGIDVVAMLPGWEASRGARLERHLATELGIRVTMVAALLGEPVPLWERPEVVAACLDKLRAWQPGPDAAPIIEAANPGGVASDPGELLRLVHAALQLRATELKMSHAANLALAAEMGTRKPGSAFVAWADMLLEHSPAAWASRRGIPHAELLSPMLHTAAFIAQITLKVEPVTGAQR